MPTVTVVAAGESATAGYSITAGARFGLDISVNLEPGVSIGTRYQQVTAAYGHGLGAHTKFFDGGAGWGASWSNMLAMGWGHKSGEVEPVFCAKSHTDAAFNTLMGNLTQTSWMVYFQEPEDDMQRGTLSLSAWRAVYFRLDTLRKAHPNGHLVKLLGDANGYSEEDAPNPAYTWQTLYSGLPLDALGADIYDDAWRAASWTAKWALDPLANAAKALGLPWCLPEVGVDLSTKTADTPAAAAGRVQQVVNYCKADPSCLWANYWEDGGAGTTSLIGTPGMAVWQSAMNS